MALNLLDPAQKSLKNSAGDQPKSALASADFGAFSALETARICAAGRIRFEHHKKQGGVFMYRKVYARVQVMESRIKEYVIACCL